MMGAELGGMTTEKAAVGWTLSTCPTPLAATAALLKGEELGWIKSDMIPATVFVTL